MQRPIPAPTSSTSGRRTPTRSTPRYKQRTFELLRLRSSSAVLDAGCGLGEEVRALAARVPSGRVRPS